MRHAITLVSVGLFALAGCSQPVAAPAPATTTTTTTTTTAPPKLSAAEVEGKIDQAVAATTFEALGGTLRSGPDKYVKTQLLTVTCGGELPSNRLITKESGVQWGVTGSLVKSSFVHYDDIKASEIFESLRKLTSCGTYVETWSKDQATVTVNGEVPLPKAAEADGQFSWCETVSPTFARCYAVLSRGAFAASVQVATGSADQGKAALGDVVPVVAKALATVG
ncbi:hypothetical protein UK23_14240 [Lentzea aerocolonigenes]|uniref:PknH-like extracellular domain-containing protein n=1 Tax=Lentzea aerocolonigenes TaxID=68170 RepID=A0A0F0H0V1_LENAE|nr:hypothetical protein [Lentzea aerocolonigenes]KJK49349.1 hypothetical protein UK23_14240 [Lentzea aerocolonigenes]